MFPEETAEAGQLERQTLLERNMPELHVIQPVELQKRQPLEHGEQTPLLR